MSEVQKKETIKEGQIAIPQAIQEKAEEEVQKKTIGEKISGLLGSIGIESQQSKVMLFCVLVIIFFSALCAFLLLPPSDFPQDKVITIEKGMSLGQVSLLLSDENFIRSSTLFEFCVTTIGGGKGVQAGRYLFKTPIGPCAIAIRVVQGISGVPAIKATIPEGLPNVEVATIMGDKIPKFDVAHFVDHARVLEGYLFPDTYFFSEGVTSGEVETTMKANFDKKIATIQSQVNASGHSLRDIIIMASILEREATVDTDRFLVSGVLWNRIKNGMPLQVDAPFLYLLGKKSSELTQSDLQTKSAYNTYKNKGLPGGPIGNPGMLAILAAINPKESPYVYYLSDDKGVMHYAKTFNEHITNKQRYLK